MPPSQSPPVNAPEGPPPQPVEAQKSRPAMFITYAAVLLVFLAGVGMYWWNSRAPMSDIYGHKTIGIISIPQVKEANDGFKSRLQALGYNDVEYLEYTVVPGPTLDADSEKAVRELIEKDADLIFANFEIQGRIAVDITRELGRTDVAILFIARLHDPASFGLVESLQSPGSNATGVATSIFELVQRHLEFIKQIRPDAKKLGIFAKGFQIPALADEYYAEVKLQAPRLGLEIVEYTTDQPPPKAKEEFERVAVSIKKGDIDALMHIAGHYYVTQEAGEGRLAIRLGIPMATNYEDIPRGGHFTFANGTYESGEQVAVMADKVFKGAKPSEIPVEYALKNKLSLHLGRARAAGITFPDSMLYLADNKYEDDSVFPEFTDH